MSRLLVLGDVHGAARAVEQVLDRASFKPGSDRLIFLGDVADGWSETPRALDLLIEAQAEPIIGNHDEWLLDWASGGDCEPIWWNQGGKATIQAYHPEIQHFYHATHVPDERIPPEHLTFLQQAKMYHVEEDMVFVHGGFVPGMGVGAYPPGGWTWDRQLWNWARAQDAVSDSITPYSKVFIGHTATREETPQKRCEVWNLDQGAGWFGRLTLMDAHTEEYWQSDNTSDLYPDELGRRA